MEGFGLNWKSFSTSIAPIYEYEIYMASRHIGLARSDLYSREWAL